MYKKIFLLIIILLLFLFGLLVVRSGFIPNFFQEPNEYVIEDECYIMMDELFHIIEDEGDCKIRCNFDCDIRGESYHYSEFVSGEDREGEACNLCKCYCKNG